MLRQNSLQIAVKRAVTSTVDCALSTPCYSLYEAVNQNFQFVFGMMSSREMKHLMFKKSKKFPCVHIFAKHEYESRGNSTCRRVFAVFNFYQTSLIV